MIPDYTSQLKKIPDMSNKVLFLKNQGLVPTTIANILYVSVRTVNRYYDTKRQDYIKLIVRNPDSKNITTSYKR